MEKEVIGVQICYVTWYLNNFYFGILKDNVCRMILFEFLNLRNIYVKVQKILKKVILFGKLQQFLKILLNIILEKKNFEN